MEEQIKACSHKGCSAPSVCEKCNGCEAHCTCGGAEPDNSVKDSTESSGEPAAENPVEDPEQKV